MQFKRQTNSQVDVNLTPLIDVVFLLLIYFMVSTTFTKETHLSLDLPEAVRNELKKMKLWKKKRNNASLINIGDKKNVWKNELAIGGIFPKRN